MPIFRADFEIKSAVALIADSIPTEVTSKTHALNITVVNAQADDTGHTPHLIAKVVGECGTISDAAENFRQGLAEYLDALSFVTQAAFQISRCLYVVEWEPFKKSRQFRPFSRNDPLYPPLPAVIDKHLTSASAVLNSDLPDYLRNALRHFRIGALSEQLEDQFREFWLTIEVISEGQKKREKQPILCEYCQGALECSKCSGAVVRIPMSTDAIKTLLQRIVIDDPQEAYKIHSRVRHGLLHGRTIESIEREAGHRLIDIVDNIGQIAWHALSLSLPKPECVSARLDSQGRFANRVLIAAGVMTIGHDGRTEHPNDSQIPKVKIEILAGSAAPPTDS